jgi:hypothetical protein
MTEELERRLAARWPTWFRRNGDPRATGMVDGFRHGDGWFELLWRLCEELEPVVQEFEAKTGEPFEVLQVKEKFGTLRFYPTLHTDEVDRRIALAEAQSSRSCERCGRPAHLRAHAMRTLCDEHAGENWF